MGALAAGPRAAPVPPADTPASSGPDRRGRPDRTRRWVQVVVMAGVALVVAVAAVRPWPLDRPVVYTGDLFQHLAMVQDADLAGTPGRSDTLAAPDGLDWSAVPTGTERLHLVALRSLDAVTGDVFVALNLYVVLGLAATIVVAFAVLRWMGAGALLAAAAAVVFSLSAAFWHRLAPGHLFLFALYPIPLGVYLALRASLRDGPGRWRGRALVWPALAVVAIALSSAYYATFAVVIVLGLGAATSLRRRDARRMLAPLVVAGAVAVLAGISLAPELVARAGAPTSAALVRTAADVRRFGLDLVPMVLPQANHPIEALAAIGRAADSGDKGSLLGLAGAVGLVWTLVVTVRAAVRPRDRTERLVVRLGVVILVSMAVATVDGVGAVLADVGFTQIRVWSRMASVILFAALAGLVLLAQRALDAHPARRPWLRTGAVVVVAALAVVDNRVVLPPTTQVERAWRSDAALVADMEQRLGPGATVFELPVISFPDDPGAERLLAPSVQADGALAFSAGFVRGGSGDWQLSWCRQSPGPLVRGLAAAGFDALLVERGHRLLSDPDGIERDLDRELGPATGRSADGTFVWYDLRPARAALVDRFGAPAVAAAGRLVRRPVGLSYLGTTRLTASGRVLGDGGAVVLRRLDGDTSPVRLGVDVFAPAGTDVVVDGRRHVVGPDGRVRAAVTVDLDAAEVTVPVSRADGGPVTVADATVRDDRLDADPVLRPEASADPGRFVCR